MTRILADHRHWMRDRRSTPWTRFRHLQGSDSSRVPSAVRTRGRSIRTRRPPRVTLPGWVPCRTAARSGSWRPLGPTSRSTSASSRLPSTPRPVPTASARRALAGGAGQLGQGDGDLLGQDQLSVGGHGRLRMLGHVAVPSGRAAWRLPDTYHTAGIRQGPPPQVLRGPGQPRACGRTPLGRRVSCYSVTGSPSWLEARTGNHLTHLWSPGSIAGDQLALLIPLRDDRLCGIYEYPQNG
jgi:hypothetical protein